MYLISMPLMMLLIRRVPAVSVEKHPMTFLQWLTAFFMCYAIMYLGNLVGLGLTFVIGMVKGSPVDNALVDIATDISPWTALVIMVLCAPVFEELIFRKLLIDRTVKYGEKTAVLFSGIFFGLFHGNLNQFAYAFGLGIFWGFIYVKTGKIRYSICMHMAVNFLGSVASVFLLKSVAYEELIEVGGADGCSLRASPGADAVRALRPCRARISDHRHRMSGRPFTENEVKTRRTSPAEREADVRRIFECGGGPFFSVLDHSDPFTAHGVVFFQ